MATRIPPKIMAKKLVRTLRPQHPDYHYLKKVFQHTRDLLAIGPGPRPKRLPDLLTAAELVALYEAIWHAQQLTHLVMLNLLLASAIPASAMRNSSGSASPMWICRRVTSALTKARGTKIAMSSFPPTSGENSRNILNASAPRMPSTCLNRDGVNPTPHGVSARLSNSMRSQQGSRNVCTPISSGISS